MLAYNLTTKEHREVKLLLPAEWLCKVERVEALEATVACEHTQREFIHNRAIVAE